MEKNRRAQVMAIVALLLAVGGLSLGFAAFSQSLTIKSSAAVSPDKNTFNVVFTNSTENGTSVTPTLSPASGFTAADATINNSDHDITGLKANFTAPGQSATYTFKAKNTGELQAYLNGVTFNNVNGSSPAAAKVCTPGSGTTAALVTAACDDISISVKVGDGAAYTSSNGSIASHALAVGDSEDVVVTITYAEGGDRADGDFTVAFGDVSLLYGSVD